MKFQKNFIELIRIKFDILMSNVERLTYKNLLIFETRNSEKIHWWYQSVKSLKLYSLAMNKVSVKKKICPENHNKISGFFYSYICPYSKIITKFQYFLTAAHSVLWYPNFCKFKIYYDFVVHEDVL